VPDVLVTDRAVYFDGKELPWLIAKDGVSFKPGGSDDISTITIEFFVETAKFELSWETKHAERWRHLRLKVALETTIQLRNIEKIMKESK
jgi:hypothetical protein